MPEASAKVRYKRLAGGPATLSKDTYIFPGKNWLKYHVNWQQIWKAKDADLVVG